MNWLPSDLIVLLGPASGGMGKTVLCRTSLLPLKAEPLSHKFHACRKARLKTPPLNFHGTPAKGDPHGKLRSKTSHHHRQQRRRAR